MISAELPLLKLTNSKRPVKIGQPKKNTSIQQPSIFIFLDVLKVDEKNQNSIPHMVF